MKTATIIPTTTRADAVKKNSTDAIARALATLAGRWQAAIEARDREWDALQEGIDRRREARGDRHTPEDEHNDWIALQGRFERADDREWIAHERFRAALMAAGTGAAIVGDDVYIIGPEGDKERGGEIRRCPLVWMFGTRAYATK